VPFDLRQSWSNGTQLSRTHCSFSSGGWNHHKYLSLLPMEGWPRWVGLENIATLYLPSTVTNPSTIQKKWW